MLTAIIVRLVDLSRRFAWLIILLTLAASIGLGFYVARTISINTDVDQLLAEDLVWRQNERELARAFPQQSDRLVVVIDSANPDMAENAAATLADAMSKKTDLFKNVSRPDASPYFQKYGLLLLPEKELRSVLDILIQAQPMLGSLAADPSLRGLFGTMSLAVEGVKRGEADYNQLAPSFTALDQTMRAVMNGNQAVLSWQSMMSDRKPGLRELRKFILTQPVLDFNQLSPGEKATKAMREMARDLGLTPENGVTVRLTGSVALNDEEFASVAEGTGLATILSVILVIAVMFLALRSYRLIIPIVITLFAGLIMTTAFAMATVGSLNLISVAFAVMFVGMAVDFGIQFGVRFRDVHHTEPDTARAMNQTAQIIATPLALAAGATFIGFIAFTPTDYSGVAELGLIAGAGMIIAFLLNITLLPALLSYFKPPAEPEAIGFAWAAPIDRFLVKHRSRLLGVIALTTLIGLVVATQTRFDFDPLNLKDPQTESVSTLFDLREDPDSSPYTIEILAPSSDTAQTLAGQIDKLPEVDHTLTLNSFLPQNQPQKLAMIDDAKFLLDTSLTPPTVLPAPTDDETFTALQKTADKIRTLGEDKTAAQQLANTLDAIVARHDPALLKRLHAALIAGMSNYLDRLRIMLSGQPATLNDITDDLRNDWVTPEGRARIEVYPKGDARDHKVLAAFTDAVGKIVPNATGAPISIQESGETVVNAFIKAGIFGVLAISILVWIVLRRFTEVAKMILTLIIAGILTLATMAAVSLPLNFANIIALPLLLSLGVSYAIYTVSYWRDGKDNPLQSSMARAVWFSAFTTLVAFGSLSLSSHPGTSGMGQLLTIALVYCVLATFLILPVLLGKPNMR